jgi:hypothetical protein
MDLIQQPPFCVLVQVCPRDYTPVLLQYIERENLPEYLGGTSKATLLDDAGPWNDQALIDEIDAELRRVTPRPWSKNPSPRVSRPVLGHASDGKHWLFCIPPSCPMCGRGLRGGPAAAPHQPAG